METGDIMEGLPAEAGKFCADCKHLIGVRWNPDESTNWKCGHKNNVLEEHTNLVTGLRYKVFELPNIYDVRGREDRCGPKGNWYEKYEKLDTQVPEPEKELEVGKGKKVGKFSLDL